MAQGGYRQGSGRSKSGYYRGIYCGSTYELAWVIYRLHHKLPVQRFEGYITFDGNRKYFPDFVVNDSIVEIKGYHTVDVDKKAEAARQAGFDIRVLYKEDLQQEFDFVKSEFPSKRLFQLFDNYKPTFSYLCDLCFCSFDSDVLKRTTKKYCSRRCSMLGVHKLNKESPNSGTFGFRKLTAEDKKKMSLARSGINKKMWVHFENAEKLVSCVIVDSFTNVGWTKGRV